jgi:hypothetical protein
LFGCWCTIRDACVGKIRWSYHAQFLSYELGRKLERKSNQEKVLLKCVTTCVIWYTRCAFRLIKSLQWCSG